MIVDQEFADHDHRDKPRFAADQNYRGKRTHRMQAGMDEAGGMTVNPLVAIEVSGLQHKIAEKVLHLEQSEAGQKKGAGGTHGRKPGYMGPASSRTGPIARWRVNRLV